jgi:hypothetical protein
MTSITPPEGTATFITGGEVAATDAALSLQLAPEDRGGMRARGAAPVDELCVVLAVSPDPEAVDRDDDQPACSAGASTRSRVRTGTVARLE